MDIQIALVLGTMLAALVLFSFERIPVDVTALGILLFLIMTGLLSPEHAFAGFGSGVVVMMLGLLILVAALNRTGGTNIVGQALLNRTEAGQQQLLLAVMVIATTRQTYRGGTWELNNALLEDRPLVPGFFGDHKSRGASASALIKGGEEENLLIIQYHMPLVRA